MKKWMLCLLVCCLMGTCAWAETVQDQALAFIQGAGIGADSVTRVDSEVIIPLPSGGTARLWLYGDFDMYDLGWRFEGAADEEVALYLDHALGLLAALEEKLPQASERMADNYAVMVSNALLDLERTGRQGLQILLSQLSLHDDSGLNSLRARLASRLLGRLDATPVDPAEGLAWYDALTIAQQDELPLPAASAYVDDPFLAEVTDLLIAHEEARRAGHSWGRDVESAKTATFVYLSAVTVRHAGDAATVFCHMASEKIALYDGARVEVLSGSWYPVRAEVANTAAGWKLTRLTEPEDGTEYWPSIVAFCEGDEALARSLTTANMPTLHAEHEAALQTWLAAIGYPKAE